MTTPPNPPSNTPGNGPGNMPENQPGSPPHGQPYPPQGQPYPPQGPGGPGGPAGPYGAPQKKDSKTKVFIGIGIAVVAVIVIAVVLVMTLGGGGGVSKADYTKGAEKIFRDSLSEGMWEEKDIPALAKCVTDKSYDKVDEEVREKIAAGQDVNDPALFEAASKCAVEILLPGD